MRNHLAIHINQAAQGRITNDDSVIWFNTLAAADQVTAVHYLVVFVGQTNLTPTRTELESVQSALTTNQNMPVNVTADSFHYTLRMLADRATTQPAGTYRLLLNLFARHDRSRRKTQCASGCTHWWHHLG